MTNAIGAAAIVVAWLAVMGVVLLGISLQGAAIVLALWGCPA